MRKYLFLLVLPFFLLGCNSNNQANTDKQIIESYITSHHLNAVAEPNGLYYVQTTAGTGGSPVSTSDVTVTYKGYFTDGTVFDQSTSAISFYLSQVIPGWTEGIPLMKTGGKASLLIPSSLAYGSSGQGSVPPNTVLIFDVYLIRFQ